MQYTAKEHHMKVLTSKVPVKGLYFVHRRPEDGVTFIHSDDSLTRVPKGVQLELPLPSVCSGRCYACAKMKKEH